MAVDTPARNALAGWRQVPVQELVLPVVIVALVITGIAIRPEVFPTSDNLLNVLTQVSITGIIAIGMTFVIATGGIDLSVGSGGGGGRHPPPSPGGWCSSTAPGSSCSPRSASPC
jgi:ABC-type xylose transport system permease subunit